MKYVQCSCPSNVEMKIWKIENKANFESVREPDNQRAIQFFTFALTCWCEGGRVWIVWMNGKFYKKSWLHIHWSVQLKKNLDSFSMKNNRPISMGLHFFLLFLLNVLAQTCRYVCIWKVRPQVVVHSTDASYWNRFFFVFTCADAFMQREFRVLFCCCCFWYYCCEIFSLISFFTFG